MIELSMLKRVQNDSIKQIYVIFDFLKFVYKDKRANDPQKTS